MLKVKDIVARQGWSEYKVLRLINLGKIPAVNTSTGAKPRWEVREEDLDAFLTPPVRFTPARKPTRKTKLIDEGVEDYFGSRK